MPSEEKREIGSALMVIGWVMVLFAFLVMFFQPAAVKLGESRFQIIAAALVAHRPGAEHDWRSRASEESLSHRHRQLWNSTVTYGVAS